MVTCDKCGRESGQSYAQCTRCWGTYCMDHRLPENHGCAAGQKDNPSAGRTERIDRDQDWYNPSSGNRPFSHANKTGTLTPAENFKNIIEILAFFLGVFFIIGGFFLFIGNRTGLHPTFPFAGFITMTLGFGMVYYAVSTK